MSLDSAAPATWWARLGQRPALLLILTTLIWGSNAVAARLAVGQVSPMMLTTARWSIACVALWVVARGINLGLQTRIYFEDEDNSTCPVLQRIEHRPRVDTLIAKRTGPGQYRFDLILQGENETVFFDM